MRERATRQIHILVLRAVAIAVIITHSLSAMCMSQQPRPHTHTVPATGGVMEWSHYSTVAWLQPNIKTKNFSRINTFKSIHLATVLQRGHHGLTRDRIPRNKKGFVGCLKSTGQLKHGRWVRFWSEWMNECMKRSKWLKMWASFKAHIRSSGLYSATFVWNKIAGYFIYSLQRLNSTDVPAKYMTD